MKTEATPKISHNPKKLAKKKISAVLIASLLLSIFAIDLSAQRSRSEKLNSISESGNNLTKRGEFRSNFVRITDASARIEENRVALSWTSENEVNILGYRVWRINDGRMFVVNSEPVASHVFSHPKDPQFEGDSYVFFDEGTKAFRESKLVYFVEIVKINSESEWCGPIVADEKSETENFVELRNASPKLSELNNTPLENLQVERVENAETISSKFASTSEFAPSRNTTTTPYGTSASIKIEVSRDGLHRIPGSELSARGFDIGESSHWILTTDGKEEPMIVYPDGSIEFYGRGFDSWQTDRRVYWLVSAKANGKRMPVSRPAFDQSAVGGTTRYTVERKDRIYYNSGILNGDRENWYAAIIGNSGAAQALNLSEVDFSSSESVDVGADIQGLDQTSHSVEVTLNGVVIGVINFDPGQRIEATLTTQVSKLREGNNEIRLRSLEGASDYNFLEAVRITYPRKLVATQNSLKFVAPSNQKVKLDGFESSLVRVFDVTNPLSVSAYELQGVQNSDGRFSVSVPKNSATRILVAQGESVPPLVPVSIVQNFASSLRSPKNSANFVVIAPKEFHAALQPLAGARNAEGIETQLVDVVDIYDEFSNGVRSADAIKTFLQHAQQNWSVKPDYVLFVGDASIDPRNYRGTGGDIANIIPTMFEDALMMQALTDDRFVDFDEDWQADMSIGRLPVRTAAEVSAAVSKILAVSGMSSSLAASRGAAMVADLPVGYDFNLALQGLSTTLPSGMPVNYVTRSTSQADSITRQQVLGQVNQGRFVVNYHGHGLVGGWSGANLLNSGDGPSLANSNSPSLMLMLACLNGFYADATLNLAESMIKNPGGAFAVFADGGLYVPENDLTVSREILTRFFAGERLGDVIRTAKMNAYDFPSPRTWILFGDPTTRLNP